MCGLAGWATTGPCPDHRALASMAEALSHRNDGEALSAVIDRQPRRAVVMAATLSDPASGVSLALDGAILNAAELRAQLARRGYPFKAKTDAELLLRAYQHWDKEVVKQLRGAFAFSVWDAAKERLLLARDRFGQKPLHLHQAGGALYFASEVKALARAPGVKAEVDMGAVGDYLAIGYVRGPRTLVAGVRKLAPGTYALWQFGSLRETRYWTPPDGAAAAVDQGLPGKKQIDIFIERLDDAVQLAMESTRPVGVLLAGGYDSAAIVALARQHRDHVATFCAGFTDDQRSELPAAAGLAKHFGTRHHEIVLERRDVLAGLPQLVASRDAPVSRPADVALHLLARQAARHVKVALSGDGGDEILGGYRRHTFLRGFAPGPRRVNGLFIIPLADPRMPQEEGRTSALRSILYYEQTGWLADNLLERSDRMTAAASLELRAPFLDHRLAEYVSALPDAARVRGLSTKWILRQADRRLIGQLGIKAGLKPRKAGFRIPLGDLMRGESRELLVDHLRGPGCLTRAYYDGKVLDRLLDEHLAARKNHEETLWTLLNLEIWHRILSAQSRPR
ncbi:MAG TPA: asparagine synthase-related protein [Burkholderiales bacterium]|nr:asparagine synthase-related protein [Burkholderiales bacterium]